MGGGGRQKGGKGSQGATLLTPSEALSALAGRPASSERDPVAVLVEAYQRLAEAALDAVVILHAAADALQIFGLTGSAKITKEHADRLRAALGDTP